MASLRSQRALTEQTNENIMQQSRQLRNKAAAGMEKAITTRQRTALGEIGNNKSQNILGKKLLFSKELRVSLFIRYFISHYISN